MKESGICRFLPIDQEPDFCICFCTSCNKWYHRCLSISEILWVPQNSAPALTSASPKTEPQKPDDVQKRSAARQGRSKKEALGSQGRYKNKAPRRRTEDTANPNGGLRKTKAVHRYGSKTRPAEDKGTPKTKSVSQGTVATHRGHHAIRQLPSISRALTRKSVLSNCTSTFSSCRCHARTPGLGHRMSSIQHPNRTRRLLRSTLKAVCAPLFSIVLQVRNQACPNKNGTTTVCTDGAQRRRHGLCAHASFHLAATSKHSERCRANAARNRLRPSKSHPKKGFQCTTTSVSPICCNQVREIPRVQRTGCVVIEVRVNM